MVDIGGYRLHIRCQGEGSPIVILDALGDGMSANWGWVQPEVAHSTRVCAYDRAGLGWSDAAPGPSDARTAAEALHALLTRAGVKGPYVLVGHSYGAHVVRLYADTYPADVVGMVLLDPGTLYHDPHYSDAYHADEDSQTGFINAAPLLAGVGLFRLSGQGPILAQGLPPEQVAQFAADYSSTHHWAAVREQNTALPQTTTEIRAVHSLGDLPLVVLSASLPADESRRVWTQVNQELAALSSKGSHRVIEGATHAGLVNDRQYAEQVARAILDMIAALQAK